MNRIKIQCPAKINLTLKILNKRSDGFHNIASIMQTINLYDYLTIFAEKDVKTEIILTGNNTDIPYNEQNLVYRASELFLKKSGIENQRIEIDIDKNIPIAAGLAGGSTDGAGTLFGLNKLFNSPLSLKELHELCASLGSDLNVCLTGGKLQTSGRGEIITPMKFQEFSVNLIKPLTLGISAKEAYVKFSQKKGENKPDRDKFVNDLEWAVLDDYKELQFIKNTYKTSTMTGSGSTYYSLEEEFKPHNGYWVKNGLHAISHGVRVYK